MAIDSKKFVEILSRKLDVSTDTVTSMIETLTTVMGECGAASGSVSISNFGVFETRKRQERIAVHPASGKRLLVPPRISMAFKTAPALKQKINDGK